MKIPYRGILITLGIVSVPFLVSSQAPVSSSDLIRQMQGLLDQYNERIRVLEAENNLLKNTMAKHQISIPRDEYEKALASARTNVSTSEKPSQNATPSTQASQATSVAGAKSIAITASLTDLQKGFINQINQDWEGIRGAYSFPKNAWIGGYEFVKDDAENHVFVGIVFGDGTPEGAYHAKLLYEFDKKTFKRKLLGLFMYNTTTKMYSTIRGTNPFATMPRNHIHGTYVSLQANNQSSSTKPATSNQNTSTNVSSATTSTHAQNVASSQEAKNFEAKITAIYQSKDYNQVLKLSEEFLAKHAPTQRIYQLRYRSYFVLRQFHEALGEMQKMEQAQLTTPFAYCEGYAIAMHAGRQDLVEKYKRLAGPGCSTTGS